MMESSTSQIIEEQDPASSQGGVNKPVMLLKNISSTLEAIVNYPVALPGSASNRKVFMPHNVGMATDGKSSALETVAVVNNLAVDVKKNAELNDTDAAHRESASHYEKSNHIYISPLDSASSVGTVYVGADTLTDEFVESNCLVRGVGHDSDQGKLKQIASRIHTDTEANKIRNNAGEKSSVIMFKWGTANKPFRCQICDLSFADGNLLRAHMEKHASTRTEPLKPFPCSLCTKSFQSKRSLERHQFVHSGQSQKRCKFCYKVFANKENLDKHMLMHSKSLVCHFCNESLSTRNAFEVHLASHTGQRQFKCKICEKSFNRKDTLDRHLITHNLGKRNKHQCVECQKSFSFLFALKRHVRSVHGDEPDGKECEICGKFIKNRENIVRHMQIHEGKRPYACPKCGRKFTQKQHLVDHLVIHTNMLPFDCKFCSLSFRYKRSLNRHHKKHYIYHSDKQKLQCVKCSDLFSDPEELMQHIEKIHCKVHQCLMCHLPFSDEETLLKHMLEIHGISVETGSKKKINLVNKSTETDHVAMETSANPLAVTELPFNIKNITSKVLDEALLERECDGEVVNKRNDVENTDETIESICTGENIIYASNETDAVNDCQQVVYILYDHGQEMEQKMEVIAETDENIPELNDQDQLTTFALDGTQVIQISEIGIQAASNIHHEMEHSSEIEFTQTDEDDNQVVEIAEEYPNLHVYQTDGTEGKEMICKYSTQQVENADGSNFGTVEPKFVADRSELIQSLIDYAKKIQEEELSMINSETKI